MHFDKAYSCTKRVRIVKDGEPLHELRIGPLVLALAPECETLLRLKARLIRDSEIQGAELLEVYWHGKEPWIFDRSFTRKEAAHYLS